MTATAPRPGTDVPDGVERTLTVAGRRIRVAVRPGTDPAVRPLVLVNGIGASLELFEPLVEVLDPCREVIRFDVPGIGGSQGSHVPLPMAALATLLADLLDQLDDLTGVSHRVVDLLGLSWGGGIAQQFALQYPRRTGRLVLASTGTGVMMVPARIGVLARMLTPRRYNDPSYRHRAGREIYVGEDAAAVDALFSRVHAGPRDGLPAPAVRAHDVDEPAGAAHDLGADARPRRSARPGHPGRERPPDGVAAPHGTVHLHEGGHLGILTRPRELGRVVEDFLGPIPPRAP